MPLIASLGVLNAVGLGFTSSSVKSYDVAFTASSPYLSAYKWTTTGLGAKYTDPSSIGPVSDVRFSPSNKSVAVHVVSSSSIAAYSWSSAGFGTQYTNPATALSSNTTGIDFSPAGNSIAVSTFSSPFVNVYQWSDTTGFGTKYANPATMPVDTTWSVRFTNSGTNIIFGSNGGSLAQAWYITAYTWSYASGFGTRWANPSSKVAYVVPGEIAVHPSDTCIAFTIGASPYNLTYAWSNTTGWGAQLNSPTITTASSVNSISFSPTGDAIIFGTFDSPYLSAFRFTTNYGTKYTAPVSVVPTAAYAAFSPIGSKILVGSGTQTFYTYAWSNGFGTLTNQNKSGILTVNSIDFTN